MKILKHMIRDALIWIVYHSGLATLAQRKQRQRGPLVRVLCFHDMPDRAHFAQLLDTLTERYCILTPEAFKAGRFDEERINLLLTFDDGYQSWIDNVMPELTARELKALFFVSSGLLDAAEAGEAEAAQFVRERLRLTQPRQLLDWVGAEQLLRAGHMLGGHTRTHAELSRCTPEQLQAEIESDKRLLEGRLDITLTDFAYPFGTKDSYNESSQLAAMEVGYDFIYTAQTGWYIPEQHLVAPRTLIEEAQLISSTMKWVEGGYDIFAVLQTKSTL